MINLKIIYITLELYLEMVIAFIELQCLDILNY